MTDIARPRRRGNRVFRIVVASTSILLPALTLLPLGSLWLWEHGYVLHWAFGAFVLTMLGLLLQWWLLREPASDVVLAGSPSPQLLNGAAGASREAQARAKLDAYVSSLTPEKVRGSDAMRNLAVSTIQLVAREMHPGEADPHWKFTVPEALLLTERVAARLRPIVIDNVPLGDQLTVRQVLRLYEWRGAVDLAERAYDIWRIVRLINPAAAITQEARERLTRRLYASLKDEFTVRIGQGYVRELGSAAIDLYSGRLRVGQQGEAVTSAVGAVSEPSVVDAPFTWSRLGTQAKNIGKFATQAILRRR
ncbi:MAG: GTP-binding protein HSR1 [Hyphomicrobium sp.]